MIAQIEAYFILEKALEQGADFAELFLEDRDDLNISFNQSAKSIAKRHIFGAGLRLMRGTRSAYVHTNDLSAPSLLAMCERAGTLLQADGRVGRRVSAFVGRDLRDPNPVTTHPGRIAYLEKILLLEKADRAVRATGSDVKNLDLNYYDNDQRVVIANSEGAWAEDRRVSSRVRVFPTLANETESTGYFVDFTRPAGFEAFQDEGYIDRALRAVGEMRASLRAPEAPYGRFPVVIEGGNPSGTFFHECCGHQLETNQPLLDNGVFLNKLGEKVASEKVTLVDDGTLPGCYGSSKFDDEGMPRQRNVLIENGVLKSYLADRMGSSLLNVPRNACGRREGYATPPAARMSNTYVACGGDDPDEMIRGIPQGLFITRMGGGNGDVDFSILAQTAYWIKNGVLDRQVKRAMLMGRGDEAMLKIDRVGRAMKYGENGMFCGGESGLCPVTTSGARIRIEEMLIGGKGGALSDD